ncbi:MAG: DEAD/DEAH box helicase [Acidimicrobiaceae bacterium]|nr:DEAD/DEAH box helicase [Acidimicrobiaceae bacterium]
MPAAPVIDHLPRTGDPDEVVAGFSDYVSQLDIELYPAQEEAIIEVALGNHVILNTPTGSGKSMVGAAAHFAALAAGKRSVYTAPIKALVSEKFFALSREFGPDLVGMVTGDAAVNADAPIICCTQEILANWALRDGRRAPVDVAVIDEFHFYGDPQRGWAWQVPLLELPRTQFVLMSATLGDVDFFRRDLTERTGRETALVASVQRPVPLHFEYRTSSLHASVSDLLASGKAPIYLVHFTQKDATDAAQSYVSLDPLNKVEKEAVREALAGFRFDSPIGRDLRRFITSGVGVHHAGLLPKYRLLVEKLAQQGLLKIICGTDTLGVGVNVPIRSVLFTQLCKYDGTSVRILSNREFAQIAGRAGRKGFDDAGDVWVQAPAHVVDNLEAERKAAEKGRKKVVKKSQPDRGYAHWTEDTFDKLVHGRPESLQSHFQVSHQMVMQVLDRPAEYLATGDDPDGERIDGCRALRSLLTDNHETRKRRREHIRRAIAIYRSLVAADLLEFPDEPDEFGRTVRVNFDLQDEFALHQPLSLWAVEAIGRLGDAEVEALDEAPDAVVDPVTHALNVLSIVEAVQENPGVVIAAQVKRAKDDLMAEMKRSGVEYEERMERLAQVEHPKPNRDWTYADFDAFRQRHPWVGSDNVRPKSIAREMFERAMTFGEYVQDYGLKRSEGVLLRYLSDVYKGLVQNVPEEQRSDDLDDVTAWLGAVVRQVDSSLIDEWERLLHPDETVDVTDTAVRPDHAAQRSIVDDERAFRVMVRNTMFDWVQRLARRQGYDALLADADRDSWSGIDAVVDAMAPYWDEFDSIGSGPDARGGAMFSFDRSTGRVVQTLADPEGAGEWAITADVDVAASAERGGPVIRLVDIAPRIG